MVEFDGPNTKNEYSLLAPARPSAVAPPQTVCGVVEVPDIVNDSVHFAFSGDKMVLSFDAGTPGEETAECLERYRTEMVLPGGVAADKVSSALKRGAGGEAGFLFGCCAWVDVGFDFGFGVVAAASACA